MLRAEDSAFARVALQMEVLPLEDLLRAVALHARRAGGPLRETLVRDGYLTEEEAVAIARALVDRPLDTGLRGARYDLGAVIGRGANGVVHVAGDRRLGRQVALKLHSKGVELGEVELGRFAHEAQVTGQLAHPSIVPVHDLGVLPDGRAFYAMKRIDGETLKDVFDGIKRDVGDYVDTWTVPHLVVVLLRVAQATAYAHDRGVVHRDIKPANVMVGDYGEVLLLDWGVARVLGQGEAGIRPVSTWRSEGDGDPTMVGTVAGTPAYMAPEQARGDIDSIGPAADVYSIGVVLYEYLVGARPFRAANVRELLDRVIEDTIQPPSQTRTRRQVPPELEALCMKCVHKDPSKRFPHGRALAEALQGFLEGSRRREEAKKLTRRAIGKSTAYSRAAEAASKMERTLSEQSERLPPWAPPSAKAGLNQTSRQWKELRSLRDDTYDEALALFQAALENEPRNVEARGGLAALYLRKMDEAEARGDNDASRFFRSQVLRYDTGVLRGILEGDSTLELATDPQGATVVQYGESGPDSRSPGRPLGSTPLRSVSLPPGSYVLRLQAPGCETVRLALNADRPERLEHRVRLPRIGELAEGYVYVPGGPFVAGGDPYALDGCPRRKVRLGGFAIGRHPVTLQDFELFLADGGEQAGLACWRGPDDLSEEQRRGLPALGISRPAAEAYAVWLGRATGLSFRLPRHDEWCKAARGVDGRVFPWGSTWEPTNCNGPDAVSTPPAPTAVGSHPADISVYGVQDLAGGVCEWVSGGPPHRPDFGWLRGGSWNSHPRQARISSRWSAPISGRGGTIGFRLVQEL